jgi:hypothetical protein
MGHKALNLGIWDDLSKVWLAEPFQVLPVLRFSLRMGQRTGQRDGVGDPTPAPRVLRSGINSPAVSRKRDIKQFRQACKEAGLTVRERYAASEALHAEKGSSGAQEHVNYGELLAWLRQWKQR